MNSALNEMTIEQLEAMIDRLITRKLQQHAVQTRTRTQEAVMDSIERNRWTSPSGAKSPQELLREDRNRKCMF